MAFFTKNKVRPPTAEEKFIAELDALLAKEAEPEEIKQIADKIHDFIPLLVRHAMQAAQETKAPSPFLEKLKDLITDKGKKLALRNILSLKEFLTNLIAALETHGPNIRRIFLEQVERYKREQEQLRVLQLTPAAGPSSTVIDVDLCEPPLKQLESVKP